MSEAFDDYRNLVADRDQLLEHNAELRARIAELEAQIAAPSASRALDMLTSAALDHYTPHMVCVPSTAWSEAMRIADAAPAAAVPDDALCESLIEASDMLWNGDMYVGDGSDLMNLVRSALLARQPAPAQDVVRDAEDKAGMLAASKGGAT